MENNKFNFEKYSKYLSKIEKNSQKKLIDCSGRKICWRSSQASISNSNWL